MTETKIQWCHKVWNPVRGCQRVSPGCQNCYAERTANRFKGPRKPYEGLVRLGKNKRPVWTGVAREVPSKLAEPLSWRRRAQVLVEQQRGWDHGGIDQSPASILQHGEYELPDAAADFADGIAMRCRGEPRPQRLRVFVNSMSDLFHKDVRFEFIAAAFGVMAACSDIDFLVLTKRPARMLEWFRWVRAERGFPVDLLYRHATSQQGFSRAWNKAQKERPCNEVWPLRNVHLVVSAEDQQRADERVPLLLQCPAAVRGVSAEPLLGPIDLGPWIGDYDCHHCRARFWGDEFNSERFASLGVTAVQFETDPDGDGYEDQRYVCPRCGGADLGTGDVGRVDEDDDRPTLDWVVLGGESGPGARPYDLAWARSLIEQCQGAGLPVFHKQIGSGTKLASPNGRAQPLDAARDSRSVWRYTHPKGAVMSEWPPDLRVREFPEVES